MEISMKKKNNGNSFFNYNSDFFKYKSGSCTRV